MNRRQKKKHLKNAIRLSYFSIELAEMYLASYGLKNERFENIKWKTKTRKTN